MVFIPGVYDALSNLINGTFMNLGYDVTSVLMHVFLFVVVYVAGILGVDITCSSMRDFQIKRGIRRSD